MSESGRSPAVAVWEFSSIADGIHAADSIAKGSPIDRLLTGTTHPGRYVVLVAGDTASVEVACDIVAGMVFDSLDHRFLPDVAPDVADVVTRGTDTAHIEGDAIGVVETATVSSGIDAADAAVKAAAVVLSSLRLADGIDGKAYLVVEGSVGDVEASVEAARDRAGDEHVNDVVIPQLTPDLRDDLAAAARFLDRVRSPGSAS